MEYMQYAKMSSFHQAKWPVINTHVEWAVEGGGGGADHRSAGPTFGVRYQIQD